MSRANLRATDLRTATNAIMQLSGQLRCRYEAARSAITEAYNFFCSAVEDRKQQVMRELDMAYNDRQVFGFWLFPALLPLVGAQFSLSIYRVCTDPGKVWKSLEKS